MTCSSCNQSLLGRDVIGRSTAGYDYRTVNQYGMGQQRGGIIQNGHMDRTNGGMNPGIAQANYSMPRKNLEIDANSIIIGAVIGIVFGYILFHKKKRK